MCQFCHAEEDKEETRLISSSMRQHANIAACIGSVRRLDASYCEKPPGISRDRAKRGSLKPTKSPQAPTEKPISRQRVPTKAEKSEEKPS